MARIKNALRKHYVAPWKKETPDTKPEKGDYKLLAAYIETVSDETDEETDDIGFYDGDGTPEKQVISVQAGYSFEGYYDAENEAMAFISGLKFKKGDDRKVWFKVVTSDNKKQYEGIATVSDIVAGEGDATEFEAFKCTITWGTAPEESVVSDM